MHPQLTLSLDTAPATSFDSFHVDDSNALVLHSLRAFSAGDLDTVQIYLWGETGTGKSHLLSAACQMFSDKGYRIAYLPGEIVNQAGALESMEYCDLLCIDDLQRLDYASEVGLFHCVNRCRETGTRIIFAADRSPDELGLKLKDLQTRLAWGLVFQLIQARSLEASDEVLGYVLRRFPRRMASLKQVVDTLDEVSLSEQRRITIPFIKSVFGEAERAALSERMR